jgi:hypothetical protein
VSVVIDVDETADTINKKVPSPSITAASGARLFPASSTPIPTLAMATSAATPTVR